MAAAGYFASRWKGGPARCRKIVGQAIACPACSPNNSPSEEGRRRGSPKNKASRCDRRSEASPNPACHGANSSSRLVSARYEAADISRRQLRAQGPAKPVHAHCDQIVVEVVSRRKQNDGLDSCLASSNGERGRRAPSGGIGV